MDGHAGAAAAGLAGRACLGPPVRASVEADSRTPERARGFAKEARRYTGPAGTPAIAATGRAASARLGVRPSRRDGTRPRASRSAGPMRTRSPRRSPRWRSRAQRHGTALPDHDRPSVDHRVGAARAGPGLGARVPHGRPDHPRVRPRRTPRVPGHPRRRRRRRPRRPGRERDARGRGGRTAGARDPRRDRRTQPDALPRPRRSTCTTTSTSTRTSTRTASRSFPSSGRSPDVARSNASCSIALKGLEAASRVFDHLKGERFADRAERIDEHARRAQASREVRASSTADTRSPKRCSTTSVARRCTTRCEPRNERALPDRRRRHRLARVPARSAPAGDHAPPRHRPSPLASVAPLGGRRHGRHERCSPCSISRARCSAPTWSTRICGSGSPLRRAMNGPGA